MNIPRKRGTKWKAHDHTYSNGNPWSWASCIRKKGTTITQAKSSFTQSISTHHLTPLTHHMMRNQQANKQAKPPCTTWSPKHTLFFFFSLSLSLSPTKPICHVSSSHQRNWFSLHYSIFMVWKNSYLFQLPCM